MASRNGPSVTGTDGSDFSHREQVAQHYKASVTNKWRLKVLIFLHLCMVVLMVTRLSAAIFVALGMRPPAFLQKQRLPKAEMWEFVWLASVLPILFGLLAIRKNRVWLLQQYLLGTFLFGLLSTLFAINIHMDDLVTYWEKRTTHVTFHGYPMVVLWYFFLVIALQLHSFECYFAYQLLQAWTPADKKKK